MQSSSPSQTFSSTSETVAEALQRSARAPSRPATRIVAAIHIQSASGAPSSTSETVAGALQCSAGVHPRPGTRDVAAILQRPESFASCRAVLAGHRLAL